MKIEKREERREKREGVLIEDKPYVTDCFGIVDYCVEIYSEANCNANVQHIGCH